MLYIYEYSLEREHGLQEVKMHAGTVLSVGRQGEHNLVLWALVRPDSLLRCRRIFVARTGARIDHRGEKLFLRKADGSHEALFDGRFVGTVQMSNGIVVHVFDCGEKSE